MSQAVFKHLRSPIESDPEGVIRKCMERRLDNFLAHAATLASMPAHPYAKMFKLAGCSYADLESSVRRHGLETTLERLFEAGVYLTHDEFRGKKEIIRSGQHIPSSISMWNNPAVKGGYVQSSSGTSGRAVTTKHSIAESVGPGESLGMVFIREFGVLPGARVMVGPVLPGFGLLTAVACARVGVPLDRWYATGGVTRANLHYRVITRLLVAQMRALGLKVPYPTYLDQNDFRPVAEFLRDEMDSGRPSYMCGFVSSIARVAEAAAANGIDLTGCCALTFGEALTDAKRHVIQAAGMGVYPSYGTTDFGGIGMPCSQMTKGNCTHVMKHGIALISRNQATSWTDSGVDSLYATSILPYSARIFINAEIGDTGVIEKATCNCLFSRLGFDLQVRDIAAISKVTAQGITLELTEVVPLLEEALPARFGGHPGDYQLCEIETGSQTEIVLHIRPRATAATPEEVLKYFLGEVKRVYGGSLSVVSWLHSEGIHAKIAPPVLASTGKFRAVRLLGSASAQAGRKPVGAAERVARAAGAL
ncbi:MAG TPA: hypothetical protein VKX49_06520 [Bryobacteraceae bacterium]|nr:hypothetical protein [Bryobacteraceae bacterium]